MSRFVTTFLNLLLAFSLVLTGTSCTCAVGHAQGTESATASATSPATDDEDADHSCCDSEHGDDESGGNCCGGGDCSLTSRHVFDGLSPYTLLSEGGPTVDRPPATPGLDLLPSAWTLDILERRNPRSAPPASSGDTQPLFAETPRYLTLQVIRI